MDFFKYFHEDTARTFPETSMDHLSEVLKGITATDKSHGYLLENFQQIMFTGLESDCIKSKIFYKKEKDLQVEYDKLVHDIPEDGQLALGDKTVQLTHGLMGITSESAELAKAILMGMASQENFDVVNIKEEIGDILVYAALIGNNLGFTLEDAMKANIAKRAKRFPNGFSEFNAVNRDLEGERTVLEGN